MAWIYYQSSGRLEFSGQSVATGYSGAPGHRNNPASEDRRNLGPIPRGRYRIEEPRTSTRTGPYVLPLNSVGHSAHGRRDFQIHGDSRRSPGAASTGCIILPRNVRERIWASGEREIEVRR